MRLTLCRVCDTKGGLLERGNKRLCEFLGTATLILVGCGEIAVGGFGSAFPAGILPVALAEARSNWC
jgi:glycerol uptake facilitator-like aquaporin